MTTTNSSLTLTTFGLKTTQGRAEQITWPALVDLVEHPKPYKSKSACPLIKLGRFENNSRGRGSKLLQIDALIADYDGGVVDIQTAAERLHDAGISAVFYTSPSHTDQKPRWRVIAALSAPIGEAEHLRLMSLLNGALGGILAPESWHFTRCYFRGRVEGVGYETATVDGQPIDTLDPLTDLPPPIDPPAPLKLTREVDHATAIDPKDDPVAQYLVDNDWVLGQGDGMLFVRCPWADQHSKPQEAGDTSAAWMLPTEKELGQYSCRHTTHGPRNRTDFLSAIGYTAASAVLEFPEAGTEDDEFGPDPAEVKAAKVREKLERFAVEPLPLFNSKPMPTWIVQNVLPRAQLCVLYGAPGSGKSFMALDLGMCIARGVAWRGHRVEQGRVIYIAAEGAGGFRKRTKAYCSVHELKDVPGFGVIAAAPSLLDNDWELVAQSIGRADVITIDTLAATTAGGDENSAETMTLIIDRCQRLALATGALVVLVHHSGKDTSKGSRGHSSLRGAADCELEITNDGGRVMRIAKQKDGDDGMKWGFMLRSLVIGFDEHGDDITSCVVEEAEMPTAKIGGRPLSPYAADINEVIQDMAKDQTTGIELKAVRDEVKRRFPAVDHSHFSRIVKTVCERMSYEIDESGESLSVV